MRSFDYSVFYGGLYLTKVDWNEFLDIQDRHWEQGFGWTPDAIFFPIPEGSDGEVWIEVLDHNPLHPLEGLLRVIEVPYRSDGRDQIFTNTIEPEEIGLPAGNYQLRFELHPPCHVDGKDYIYRIRFIFTPDENPEYRIIKNDPITGMTSDRILCRQTGHH